MSELLIRELSDLRRFCVLLDEERAILTGAAAERLPELTSEKSALALQLSRLAAKRDALLKEGGFAGGRKGIDAWLSVSPEPTVARRRWDELLALAKQARDGNETNGRLIKILLGQNQEALSVLLSGGNESIYGDDGQPRGVSAGKRSFGAA